jgi:hypothetical protein
MQHRKDKIIFFLTYFHCICSGINPILSRSSMYSLVLEKVDKIRELHELLQRDS